MANPPQEIPVDEEGDDSGIDDRSTKTITTSISSSITNYRYENGRRYHAYKEGAYWGPNDEQAADHLDISHHLFLMTLDNKLYLAPIRNDVQKVLDIGTGTGIWAIDFADQHPSAQVIGTDLSPTQPSFVPPNCKFEIDDANEIWTFPKESFDFIHLRAFLGCVPTDEWPNFYKKVLEHLKPGGYIEQLEYAPGFKSDDGTVTSDRPIGQWGPIGLEAGDCNGRTLACVYNMRDQIAAAGFTDVVETKYKWPIGPWGKGKKNKELGQWVRLHLEQGLENWCLAVLTRVMGWTLMEAEVLIAKLKADLKDPKIHAYHEMGIVYARKPLKSVGKGEDS